MTAVEIPAAAESASVEHYRRCIDACICPECGAGPFKSMPGHASRVCGISRVEMRRRAQLPASASISSPECSAEASERAKASGSVRALSGYVESIKGVSISRELPDYSRKRISDNARKVNDSLSPAERSARMSNLSKSQAPASRKLQANSLSEWHKANPLRPEDRALRAAAMQTPEAAARRAATLRAKRKPCGTTAAYKRGCRCDRCKRAKSASRG